MKTDKIRITVQVLNGATGEMREVVANVKAKDEQTAVDKLFSYARKDDHYYRFLGHSRVIAPRGTSAVKVEHFGQTYYALEGK